MRFLICFEKFKSLKPLIGLVSDVNVCKRYLLFMKILNINDFFTLIFNLIPQFFPKYLNVYNQKRFFFSKRVSKHFRFKFIHRVSILIGDQHLIPKPDKYK